MNDDIKVHANINPREELEKEALTHQAGDSDGEYSSLGSSGPEDAPDGDIDPGGVMDIDKAREAVGEESDGDWEHRNELSSEALNTNNNSVSQFTDPIDENDLVTSE